MKISERPALVVFRTIGLWQHDTRPLRRQLLHDGDLEWLDNTSLGPCTPMPLR
jgi:hypothetical protein